MHSYYDPKAKRFLTPDSCFLENTYKGRALFKSADAQFSPTFNWLHEIWQEARTGYNLLVIDEIQKLENWSEIVKKLWDEDRKQFDVLKTPTVPSL